ncbi:branched-chain amino acid ABC transporter substrate-binding protein [Loktanella sp. S4079]|uniref:branched-chain amino acid ABC transporter substrate-binding protein n=1 Tax=Loktanella sp. S4079 TaxID=579483 RepID=UPI000A6B87EB|nr:branched-chain amino acid ABC transporter substrate-binding protein [Loktanella sp. S4079]
MNKTMKGLCGAVAGALLTTSASYADTIKIAFIDPLSGPFAATGENAYHLFQYAVDAVVNDQGGVLDGDTFELIGLDNKISATETLIHLQTAIDDGVRYIVQGQSSGVAAALIDAISKHNRRNPDQQVLFLNYAAIDPALTNEACSFWHFSFDANSDLKMDALTDVIAQSPELTSGYLINQDYSFGRAVAASATAMLADKRPDITIAGDEVHPIGQVKDFTPYARKIVSSGADFVITGAWGADMYGLGTALISNGFTGPIYTYYAAASGITAGFGEAGKGSLFIVAEGQTNPPVSEEAAQYVSDFKTAFPGENFTLARTSNVMRMLAAAINEAGTATDVVAVANALEGLEIENPFGGTLYMRPDNHQLIQDVHVMAHTDEDIVNALDGSPFGLRVSDTVAAAGRDAASSCEMDRP